MPPIDKRRIQITPTLAITRLGFGCARLFGGSEFKVSAALIETALRCGIRHFDTAPAYGSEDVLGAALANIQEITISTKIGLPRINSNSSKSTMNFGPMYRRTLRPLLARMPATKSMLLRLARRPAATTRPPKRSLGRDEVMRELDRSLRGLRRASIDLYLLHEPDGIEITDELRDLFQSLQNEGVIGAYGLAFGGRPTEALSFGTVVQSRFSTRSPDPSCVNTTQIYHGVLRDNSQEAAQRRGGRPASARMAGVLAQHPAAAAIFSASTPYQIRQITETCR